MAPLPLLWSSCSSIYANTLKSHTHTGIDNARGKMRWDWFGSGVVANKWFINLGLWSILGVLFMPYESVVVGWGKGKDCLYVWCDFLLGFPFGRLTTPKPPPPPPTQCEMDGCHHHKTIRIIICTLGNKEMGLRWDPGSWFCLVLIRLMGGKGFVIG